MKKDNSTSGGMALADVLLIVFIVLKLTGVINWSWWWVLSPLWISLILCALILLGTWLYIVHDDNKYKKRNQGKWKF